MATVKFKRIEKNSEIENIPIDDGNFIVTKNGNAYIDFGNERVELVNKNNNGDSLPIGSTILWIHEKIPTNWLELNGQIINRTEYKELFNLFGDKYGAGDGVNTFQLPNWRGRSPAGFDSDDADFNDFSIFGGEKKHVLTKNELPKVSVDGGFGLVWKGGHLGNVGYSNSQNQYSQNAWYQANLNMNGGEQPHNNMHPYFVTKYIIKAKND